MSNFPEKKSSVEMIEQQAAAWVLRLDRGLSPAEQDDFSQWLAANPDHGAAIRRYRDHWGRLDRLGQWLPEHSMQPNPDLLAPPLRQRMVRFVPAALALATAAALVVGFIVLRPAGQQSTVNFSVASKISTEEARRVLEDGSVVELNSGAVVTAHYTAAERRVTLERGEAHFAVAKNPHRPFIVSAHGVDVSAVGTAFNVRLDTTVVEVLVTEGRVQLKSVPTTARKESAEEPAEQLLVPLLSAKQRAVINFTRPFELPQIATLTSGEIERVLAWQHRLLDFTAAPLSAIVAEFNRHNEKQIVLVDQELAGLRISATFRSDNIEGFVRLVESGFGVQVERVSESEIRLHKKSL